MAKQPIKLNEKTTILVVDDDQQIREVLTELLNEDPFTVINASSAEEALAIYVNSKPDLILLDIMLGGMSGLELTQLIRRNDQITPIIIISGEQNIESAIEALRFGANDYIMKPFGLEHIEQSVKRLMKTSELELAHNYYNNFLEDIVSNLNEENKRLKEHIKEENKVATNTNGLGNETFYRSIAHDMNGEFSHITYALKTIRKLSTDSPEIQEECDLVERSLQYSGQLLRRLRNYIDIGKPQLEQTDIPDLIKRSESLIRPRMYSNVQLEITAGQSVEEKTVSVDVDQVVGVLLELTNNAMNALRNEGGIIHLNFDVQGERLVITVSDNGPGIPEEIRENLLKEQVRSSKERGLGLGLFLSNKVLNTFGGTLSLQDSSNGETTFLIQLPLYENQRTS
jgi:DNA-binding response OmpR family regulator/two-component sensor histidine kinase